MITAGRNPGSHPGPEAAETFGAYADPLADASTLDVDWDGADFDRHLEQTLGGGQSS